MGFGDTNCSRDRAGCQFNKFQLENKLLSVKPLTDVTQFVSSSGYLNYKPDKGPGGLEQVLFASYLVHSEYREVQSLPEITAAVPQSPITSYTQNGSWAVDHFSAEGDSGGDRLLAEIIVG